jgi:hypothetical protein
MNGRVAAASLVIEEGAFFEGQFRMVTGDQTAVFDEVDEEDTDEEDEEDSTMVAGEATMLEDEEMGSELFSYSDDTSGDDSEASDDTLMELEAEEEVA